MDDEGFMREALVEAKKGYDLCETPIGAVVVCDDKVIGRGFNLRNTEKNPLAHAELIAIEEASRYLSEWRLEGCTIYVTVEPCPMCAGAIVQSRIKRLVYGSDNKKAGSCGSVLNIVEEPKYNHQVETTRYVLENECSELMTKFFSELRNKV